MSWPLVSLGQICEFKYGKSLAASVRDGGELPVYGSNGVVGKHSEAITDGATIVIGRKGSIGELNYSSTSCWPIDTTYFVDKSCTEADLRWLFHALAGLRMPKMNKAAAIPGLNRNDAYAKQLRLPPLPEQRRIAAILDKADALRAKRREAIAKLDQLLQSVFLDMFGDPVTNPKAEVVSLSFLCERITDGTHQSPTWADDGVPFLFQSNVKPGEINYDTKRCISREDYAALTARCPIEYGDVLYTIVGSYGNAAMVRTHEPFCFQRHIAHLKPRADVLPDFLETMLNQPTVKRQADERVAGVAQKTLILKELRQLRVLKPDMGQQQRFRKVCASLAATKQEAVNHAGSADQLFESLQKNAFSGAL